MGKPQETLGCLETSTEKEITTYGAIESRTQRSYTPTLVLHIFGRLPNTNQCTRRGSNPQLSVSKTEFLPIELRMRMEPLRVELKFTDCQPVVLPLNDGPERKNHVPDRGRTCNIQLRRLTLFQLSYRNLKIWSHPDSNRKSNVANVL